MRTPDEIHDLDETLFELGDIIITQSALEKILELNIDANALIGLHVLGCWDDLPESDRKANENAVKCGGRIFSRYTYPENTIIYVITEWDRSLTTVLLSEEY